jgi:hypothetical protein
MIKIILTSILFISLSQVSFCQSIDKRLLVKYTKQELKTMQLEKPAEYTFLVTALDKGMFIGEIPAEKEKSIVFDGELDINPKKNHTHLSLGKEITDNYQYYRIKNTNQMVVILPKIFLLPVPTEKK